MKEEDWDAWYFDPSEDFALIKLFHLTDMKFISNLPVGAGAIITIYISFSGRSSTNVILWGRQLVEQCFETVSCYGCRNSTETKPKRLRSLWFAGHLKKVAPEDLFFQKSGPWFKKSGCGVPVQGLGLFIVRTSVPSVLPARATSATKLKSEERFNSVLIKMTSCKRIQA